MASRSSISPRLAVYPVFPASSDATAASTTGAGETKSGSPMPSEITSSIVAAISKKRRMPEGGTVRMRSERRPARRSAAWRRSAVTVSMNAECGRGNAEGGAAARSKLGPVAEGGIVAPLLDRRGRGWSIRGCRALRVHPLPLRGLPLSGGALRFRPSTPPRHSAIRNPNSAMVETDVQTFQNLIGGQWRDARSGETFESRNPARTSDVVGRFPASGPEDVADAVAAAKAAFETWRLVPAPKRGEILKRIGDLLTERKAEIARAMTREMGKPFFETKGDVQEAIDTAYYAMTM